MTGPQLLLVSAVATIVAVAVLPILKNYNVPLTPGVMLT